MKRAALYARVSTEKQRDEATIASQVLELKKQIALSGNVLVKEYIDDGYSGTMLDRPALEELRRDAKGDVFEAIYFLCADRIAREVAHQTIIVDELRKCRKQIVIGGKDYEHNPENRLTLTMLGAFAEFERAKIIERTSRGWRHRVRSGGIVSQGNCTYGYDYVRKTPTSPAAIVLNAQEAGIVRWIFATYAGGMGLTTITRTLEEQHVATKRGRKLWRTESVRRLLDNPAYTGVRYFNMTPRADDIAQKGSGTRPWRRERTAGEWVGVPVPAIVTQDLFDRVQQRLRDTRAKYRQPCAPYLLGGFVECGECGAGFSGYRRYVTKRLTIGKRRVYHKAAYKCNFRTTQNMHARANITRCENREVVTHLLEDAVFDIIRTTMLDPVKLRTCIDALKNDAETDHTKIAASLMEIAREIQAAEERKRQLIDLYASGNLSEEAYVNANVDVDREVHALKLKKADVVRGLPLLHKESIDVSIRQFSDAARVRLDACVSVEDKRQFLTDFVERIVYDRYRVVVVGCVTIKTQTSDAREIETRKLSFSISGEIDKNNLHKKPRKKFAEDGRLKAFGSGGRKQTVLVATS